PIDWRLVFLVSVPVGLFGTVWSWRKLEERGVRRPARIDWWGNITFASGLVAILVAITYGIQPYGGHTMGWTNPRVVSAMAVGVASGWRSDRFGARPFATGGMVLAALAFYLFERIPVNFAYAEFAALLLLVGIGMGLFASPNQAGIMNSLPPDRRGAGAGMATTFQNSALVLSIGIFFTLMVLGLAGSLPGTLDQGLRAQGVAPDAAQRIS